MRTSLHGIPLFRSVLCGPPPTPPCVDMVDLVTYFSPKNTTSTIPLVEVCEAQTKLLDQALLPKVNERIIGNAKVDYVVQLNHEHPY
ncbi:hypothetical protein EV426DRAFT_174938 [Tirmania nivea]|nr:hypothetical protein EV426DRAFT_174938 [Tirmania nivea]